MNPHVYTLHRGVNRPIEFRGLKAQYILYAFGIVLACLIAFAIAYICGLSPWIDLLFTAGSGTAAIAWTYRQSNKYGQFGRMKRRAARHFPKAIRYDSRKIFYELNTAHKKQNQNETNSHQ